MTASRGRALRKRGGFTVVELVLAAGLLSVLMVAVFALIDGSLQIWRRSETRRNLTEQATGVVELLAHDLQAIEGGARGDMLVEWTTFDTDGDELKETVWPRLRFVRQASAAELALLQRRVPAPPAPGDESAEEEDAEEDGASAAAPGVPLPLEDESFVGPAMIEVCWTVVPTDPRDRDHRAEGLLYRGARRLSGPGGSFFDQRFVRADGRPQLDLLEEVSGGLLWLQPLMATQTSIVHDGWEIGGEYEHAATSWDAWRAERPDPTIHEWNAEGRGMPDVDGRPLLPRRIRIELEFERPADRLRRARTLGLIEVTDVAFDVSDGRRLPGPGSFVKVDGEWMLVRELRGDHVTVKRGQRGTQILAHQPGALVHWGLPLVREVPVALYREDWDL